MGSRQAAGREATTTRTAILDATEAIMREDGYAAVSSRRVAQRAGLKSQLVYYHFGAMDELFLAVYRRTEEQFFRAHAEAMASPTPIRALWVLGSDPSGVGIVQEFLALANHRKMIRREIIETTVRLRTLQTAIFRRVLGGLGLDEQLAEVLPFVIISLSGAMVSEAALGVTLGHEAVRDFVERRLRRLEPGPERPGPDPAEVGTPAAPRLQPR